MKKKLQISLLLALSLAAVSCKIITGDPVIVRAEQTQQIAYGTFKTVLEIDDANRAFWKTNAPDFHAFCEWLRVPVKVGTNTLPRDLAFCYSLGQVKTQYKQSLVSSNLLITTISTVEVALSQAQNYLAKTQTNQ